MVGEVAERVVVGDELARVPRRAGIALTPRSTSSASLASRSPPRSSASASASSMPARAFAITGATATTFVGRATSADRARRSSSRGPGIESTSMTTSASEPDSSAALPIQASMSPPLATTRSADASASTSSGRGSYSCGSVFAASRVWTSTVVAADLAHEVADHRCRCDHGGRSLSSPPQPAISRATAPAVAHRASGAPAPGPGRAPRSPPPRTRLPRARRSLRPGGAFSSTESTTPAMPSAAHRAIVASCHVPMRESRAWSSRPGRRTGR